MKNKTGFKIKKLRKEKKLTLEELANLIDSKKSYVWEMENKPNSRPSAIMIMKLSKALDITCDYLLNDEVTDLIPDDFDKLCCNLILSLSKNKKKKAYEILKIVKEW
jgi:transcriptional regulator with XRE-family HTH domain